MPEPTARLFSALLLPEEVATSLRCELSDRGGLRAEQGLRWMPVEQWHITLGFYGLDDPGQRAEWLRRRLADSLSATLHIDGSGTFRGVLWSQVHGIGLAELAAAVRPDGDARDFRAHLTLARGPHQLALERWRRRFACYRSPEWTATEVALMRSDLDERGSGYSVVERFPLGSRG